MTEAPVRVAVAEADFEDVTSEMPVIRPMRLSGRTSPRSRTEGGTIFGAGWKSATRTRPLLETRLQRTVMTTQEGLGITEFGGNTTKRVGQTTRFPMESTMQASLDRTTAPAVEDGGTRGGTVDIPLTSLRARTLGPARGVDELVLTSRALFRVLENTTPVVELY